MRRYNDDGPEALAGGRHANLGHAPLLDAAGMADLQDALTGSAPDGGLWSGPKVAPWMTARIERPVSAYRGWVVLRRVGYTPPSAPPRRPGRLQEGGSKPH